MVLPVRMAACRQYDIPGYRQYLQGPGYETVQPADAPAKQKDTATNQDVKSTM